MDVKEQTRKAYELFGSGDFLIVGGTGKYENISGKGFSSRQNLKGKSGFAHSMNQMSGSYTF